MERNSIKHKRILQNARTLLNLGHISHSEFLVQLDEIEDLISENEHIDFDDYDPEDR